MGSELDKAGITKFSKRKIKLILKLDLGLIYR